MCLVRLVRLALLVLLALLGEMVGMEQMGKMARTLLMTTCKAAIEGELEFAANQLVACILPAPLALALLAALREQYP